MTATERFDWARTTPSDIAEHVPMLCSYAVQCNHITEFGVRGGVSTSAWLFAAPAVLRCYDIAVPECLKELEDIALKQQVDFQFTQADTSKVEIERTDLLFLDTLHNGEHVAAELRNAGMVQKYLIFHDTEMNGWAGEANGSGLKKALIEFLLEHTEWRVLNHVITCNGLTVLQRIGS